jgi:hypothetical protein
MFSLGEKLRVLNSNSEVTAYSAAGTPIVGVPTAITDSILIDGFGEIALSKVTDVKLHRAVLAANESKDYTVVAASLTGLAIGDVVEVEIGLKTSRYQSEIHTDLIGGAGSFKFSTAPLTAITDTAVAAAIVAAYDAFVALFNQGSFEIEVLSGGAGVLEINTLPGYESVNVQRVEIRRSNQGLAYQTPVALAVAATNTVGTEGLGTGKFLEESVRMATGINTDPYGVDNASTQVDLRGVYTGVMMTVLLDVNERISPIMAGHAGLQRTATLTIWCNESTMIAAGDAINIFAEAAVLIAAAGVAGVTTTVIAAPLTAAQESTEALIIADGSSVATASGVGSFIA